MRILDPLERRIVAALQADGRAPWRRIATALGEPERTVTRRGTELLSSGMIAVVGLRMRAESALLRLQCSPGTSRVAAETLAQRPDTTFSYLMTGGADCVAELVVDAGRLGPILSTEIPATVGLVRAVSYPILRYFRTIRGWTAGALTAAEAAALRTEQTADRHPGRAAEEELAAQDERIAAALAENGRAPLEWIARRAGVSESTAGRRVDWLLAHRRLQIRTIVEPAAVGLPLEALLWIKAAPGQVEHVGRALAARPEVRYAAAVAGEHQLVADVTLGDGDALYRFTTEADWTGHVQGIEATMLLGARKRGGHLLPAP